jgi:hypothetical protein
VSNSNVFAVVTRCVRTALLPAASQVPGAKVVVGNPGKRRQADDAGIVVCLYRVSRNAELRASGVPIRRADGSSRIEFAGAWDLHFLVTSWGDPGLLVPERLMGAALAQLEENNVLSEALLSKAREGIDPVTGLRPEDFDLGQPSPHLVPEALTPDELRGIWRLITDAPYELSIGYRVGAVLMRSPEQLPAVPSAPVPAITPG